MVEISTVSPLTLLSGTWPSRPNISREVCDITYASLIMQPSQSRLGHPKRSICHPTPLFNSRTSPSPMLEDYVWGSVCLIWQPASRNLLLNCPSVCALAPSMNITCGTPSLWKINYKASRASLSFFIGYAIINQNQYNISEKLCYVALRKLLGKMCQWPLWLRSWL
jgi:hypothetical protein